jgi:steroid delta-isomerase-like uncharacterized protein
MPTQLAAPADVARAVFEAVNARDPDRIVSHVAEDVDDDFVAIGPVRGRAAVHAFFVETFAAFPDFRMEVLRVVADDEAAVVQWRADGTFLGADFQGVRATGKPVSLKGVDVMVIRDGLVRANTIYSDGATFARQIGLLPPQGSTRDRMLMAAFNTATRVRRRT